MKNPRILNHLVVTGGQHSTCDLRNIRPEALSILCHHLASGGGAVSFIPGLQTRVFPVSGGASIALFSYSRPIALLSIAWEETAADVLWQDCEHDYYDWSDTMLRGGQALPSTALNCPEQPPLPWLAVVINPTEFCAVPRLEQQAIAHFAQCLACAAIVQADGKAAA